MKNIRRLLSGALACAALVAASARGEEAPRKGDVKRLSILATVLPLEARSKTELRAVPITFDARFVFRVRVLAVISGESPWPVGDEVAFSIHSPARTFGGVNVATRTLRFTFRVGGADRGERDCRYCLTGLEFASPPPPAVPSATP